MTLAPCSRGAKTKNFLSFIFAFRRGGVWGAGKNGRKFFGLHARVTTQSGRTLQFRATTRTRSVRNQPLRGVALSESEVSICAGGRTRTADPLLFRQMLYQLSYPSKCVSIYAHAYYHIFIISTAKKDVSCDLIPQNGE